MQICREKIHISSCAMTKQEKLCKSTETDDAFRGIKKFKILIEIAENSEKY